MTIWCISDTHFNHANILTFEDHIGKPVRPFDTVGDMNETMIENWNKVVKPGDKVYHLGDVCFGSRKDYAEKIHPRLNGKKRLIVGNHDNILETGSLFQKVLMWRKFDWLLLTHVPVHESTLRESRFNGYTMTNIHGHIHQNKSPDGPYRCVCVEHTKYTPVNLEELRDDALYKLSGNRATI